MIKSLRMVNFKSFKDTTVDFTGKRQKPKHLVFIYGENGAGKTHLISAFEFLAASIDTVRTYSILDRFNSAPSNDLNRIKDILTISNTLSGMENVKMIGAEGPTELTYLFEFNHEDYEYILSYDKGKVLKEILSFPINKKMVEVFSLTVSGDLKLNPNVFSNKSYEADLCEKGRKFAGKSTFLAILNSEIERNSEQYMKESVSSKLLLFIHSLIEMTVSCTKKGDGYREDLFNSFQNSGFFHDANNLLSMLVEGTVSVDERQKIERTEKMVDYFFTSLFSDLRGAKYLIKETKTKNLEYHLVFSKMIEGKIREIPAQDESTGTLKILNTLPSLIAAIHGDMVFIDELDSGVHDMMIYQLMDTIKDKIKGQLIVTTHNSLLMNAVKPEQAYIISMRGEAEKEIFSLDQVTPRIQKNHNVAERYLKGFYGGSPLTGSLDVDYLMELDKR